MVFKRKTIVTIDKTFRTLIQKQHYEKYVLFIINKSQVIFRDIKFTHIKYQAHGESDFIDNNGLYYDTKLLFDKKQGALIGDPKNNLDEWLHEMLNEKTEFGEKIWRHDLSFLPTTRLYNVMKERLSSVKREENVIFFIPFPIVDEYKGSIVLQSTTDYLQTVYQQLVDDCLVEDRQVFFIYPSGVPHEYVLRDAERAREYIKCDELDDFIKFETHDVME